jgi:CheY-like chemotaxis protein
MSQLLKLPVIALIDDDDIFQFTSFRIIKATKLTDNVKQFYNGSQAIDYLKDNAKHIEELPDIIFLDINMPISDGWMFLDNFCELQPYLSKKMKIYMVSSSISPEDIKRANSHPFITEYLTKPLAPEKFEELIKC